MEKIGFKMIVKERVIDDERGDATEEVEVREAERKKIRGGMRLTEWRRKLVPKVS